MAALCSPLSTATGDDQTDFDAFFQKARTEAAKGNYFEALISLEKAMRLQPNNEDLLVFHARMLFWEGRLSEAWDRVEVLSERAFIDPDVRRFAIDLAYRLGDYPEALRRLDQWLYRYPEDREERRRRAIINLLLHNDEEAEADFLDLCTTRVEDDDSCAEWRGLVRARRDLTVEVLPGYQMMDGKVFGWNLLSRVGGIASRRWEVFGEADLRNRDYGAGFETDVFLRGGAVYMPAPDVSLGAAASATPFAVFSPQWGAEVEGGYAWVRGFWTYLKLQHIEFSDLSADLVIPRVFWYVGPFLLDGRYYLTVDDGSKISHSGMGIAHAFIGTTDVHVGGGGGNSASYMEVATGDSESFWLALAGVAVEVTPEHRVQADYSFRRENAGSREIDLHQFVLGYVRSF